MLLSVATIVLEALRIPRQSPWCGFARGKSSARDTSKPTMATATHGGHQSPMRAYTPGYSRSSLDIGPHRALPCCYFGQNPTDGRGEMRRARLLLCNLPLECSSCPLPDKPIRTKHEKRTRPELQNCTGICAGTGFGVHAMCAICVSILDIKPFEIARFPHRRGGRVAEGGGLLILRSMVCSIPFGISKA